MSLKTLKKCPNCGASLELDSSLETAYCQYCGYKIVLHETQKTEHTTIIKDEAEVIRANLEVADYEDRKRRLEIVRKREKKKRFIIVAAILVAVIAIVIVIYNNTTHYDLIKTEAYTDRAFKIKPNELIDSFIKMDTHSNQEYGLSHTEWISFDNDEKYFVESFEKLYHNEHRYECYFYKPQENQMEKPKGLDDKRVYYHMLALTDQDDNITYFKLSVVLRNETVIERKKLNGYFGITLPGEIFSILSQKNGDFVISKFAEAQSRYGDKYTIDGKVRYTYKETKNAIEYYMAVTYSK